jgi:hypothetical protein
MPLTPEDGAQLIESDAALEDSIRAFDSSVSHADENAALDVGDRVPGVDQNRGAPPRAMPRNGLMPDA